MPYYLHGPIGSVEIGEPTDAPQHFSGALHTLYRIIFLTVGLLCG